MAAMLSDKWKTTNLTHPCCSTVSMQISLH